MKSGHLKEVFCILASFFFFLICFLLVSLASFFSKFFCFSAHVCGVLAVPFLLISSTSYPHAFNILVFICLHGRQRMMLLLRLVVP